MNKTVIGSRNYAEAMLAYCIHFEQGLDYKVSTKTKPRRLPRSIAYNNAGTIPRTTTLPTSVIRPEGLNSDLFIRCRVYYNRVTIIRWDLDSNRELAWHPSPLHRSAARLYCITTNVSGDAFSLVC